MYEIVSPSASVAVGAQVSVLPSAGDAGVNDTADRTGKVLVIVTAVADIAVPDVVPSLGVTRQYTELPLEK